MMIKESSKVHEKIDNRFYYISDVKKQTHLRLPIDILPKLQGSWMNLTICLI